MTFRVIVQLWKTKIIVIVSLDAGLIETPCIFQWILERKFMNFAWKLVYLTVLASVQFAISQKEYATFDAIMAYLNLTPFRIKVDRIFNG